MMDIKIHSYWFCIMYTSTNHCFPRFWIYPQEEYFGYFYRYFSNSSSIIEFIKELKIEQNTLSIQERLLIGENETYITIFMGKVYFYVTLSGYKCPLVVENEQIIKIFSEYLNFVLKYESCQIPGIIPQSKLATWSSVPNEYVKEEWWELQQKSE